MFHLSVAQPKPTSTITLLTLLSPFSIPPLPTQSKAVTAANSHLCLSLLFSSSEHGIFIMQGRATHIEICYPAAMFKRHYLLSFLCFMERKEGFFDDVKSCFSFFFFCSHCICLLSVHCSRLFIYRVTDENSYNANISLWLCDYMWQTEFIDVFRSSAHA